MSPAPVELTPLQQDAFTELVNIGVSRAAASLRKMIGVQVLLSVPSVEIVSRRDAARLVAEREASDLVVVHQSFAGAFSGRALLIFPQETSRELVRAVTGEELSAEEVEALEDEALTETGNIILNGCLATMANMLQRTLTMSLPAVMRGDGRQIFRPGDAADADTLVLFLYINFSVRERDIRGYIAMLMDLPSLENLRILIDDFIVRAIGETGE
ncbi:CheC, inhibitor of MCP methylation [Methylobacterium sp. 4-46]|uniref:chemotaxis protein CheX n=1 Tax=unclassified Methylobacterium TaxID=2615210 RepID=UPI000152D3D4|nr:MULTISPECIES: chemotaxis protein CheX [Methylobacterium]ACA16509.1 CheC, inhibitor of MCP methylation [Methylobacterium sp. 4-46]WFT82218.1 chemotaxis protein CheX [Methylobacterium nodulans]